MISQVKKRDGRVIPFNSEKITRAIFLAASEVSARDGGTADYNQASMITGDVEKLIHKKFHGEVPTVEDIQDAVVKVLIEGGHAATSETYILYRAERSRIRNSKTRLMKSIEDVTFLDAKDSDLKRENANINGNTAMGTMLQYGSIVSKEFCKDFIISSVHSAAHDRGDIHIHDMDFLNMGTLTCCQIDLDEVFAGGFSTGHGFLREPQDITSYAALAAIAIQSNQNDQHGGQSIPTFDYNLANGVRKTYRKLYRENLYKALSIMGGTLAGRKEALKDIESVSVEAGTAKMTSEASAFEAEAAVLGERYALDDETVKKAQEFAKREALVETERKTYQSMEAFIHNLNTMHSRAGAQVPFSSVNFGTDITEEGRMVTRNLLLAQEAGLGNGETPIFPILIFKVKEGVNLNAGDPNYDLFRLAMRVSSKRLFPNFSFLDAPYNLKHYQEGRPETEAAYMGCRTRVMANVNGEAQVMGRGNLSFTTLNLPRLGIKHGIVQGDRETADFEGFYRELDEKLELICQQLLERFEVQASKRVLNFPFLMGQGVWKKAKGAEWNTQLREILKDGTLSVGFIGLAECLIALTGKHHGEDEASKKLGLEIIGHIRGYMDRKTEEEKLNFTLIATPAEGLSGRFTRIDKKEFGVLAGITDKEYYTNSFHVPVYHKISAYNKIMTEAPYHEMTNAGHITYIELNGNPGNNLEAFEKLIKAMKEAGIGYGSLNHPLDRDPVCGFNGVIGDTCPSCGREEGSQPFERIRRITGYLVGTLDRFNDAKQSEVRDRIKHSQV
jgi:ribonucleoside-triphosphate reductase